MIILFQHRSQKADEYIRLHIKDQLEKAVRQCIQAAGHEFEPKTQKQLLRVCQYIEGIYMFIKKYFLLNQKVCFTINLRVVATLLTLW